jgi:AraC family transcriptional regulator of adaptative response / DNA-3-methyladenine glycosylase II
MPARAPFDGAGVLRFLATRALPGVESATDSSYGRTVHLPHGSAVVDVTLGNGCRPVGLLQPPLSL